MEVLIRHLYVVARLALAFSWGTLALLENSIHPFIFRCSFYVRAQVSLESRTGDSSVDEGVTYFGKIKSEYSMRERK